MSILTRLRAQARYNVLTPIFLLSLGAAFPALAANTVVDAPTADVVVGAGDSLTNRSTITGDQQAAVSAGQRIDFIDNEAGGQISSSAYDAVFLAQGAESVTNAGLITSISDRAINSASGIDTFINSDSGVISGYDTAIFVAGDVNSFKNAGRISSEAQSSVIIAGGVDTFENSGEIIAGGDSAIGVHVALDTISFKNTGIIFGEYRGVHFSGDVGTIENASSNGDEGIGATDTAIYAEQDVGSIINDGNILSLSSHAIHVLGHVESFDNSESILSVTALPGKQGVFFGSAGNIKNSGVIRAYTGDSIRVTGNVGSILNDTDGEIIAGYDGIWIGGNAGSIVNQGFISAGVNGVKVGLELSEFQNTGTISTVSTGLYVGKHAGTIVNNGKIESTGYSSLYFNEDVETVINTGTLSATAGSGIYVTLDAGQIINTGKIEAENGVSAFGNVDQFINSGKITTDETAIYVESNLLSFTNTGDIVANDYHGLYVDEDLHDFKNSGLISGYKYGVFAYSQSGDFENTGTISGATGVEFSTGGAYLKNSGRITGEDGIAVKFAGDDNTLAIETGARFVGYIDFASGANSLLNAENFHGSTVIQVAANSLLDGNVIAGNNYYYQDPNFVAIVGGGFVTQSSQPVENLVGGLGELVTTKLGMGDAISNPADLVSGYVAQPQNEAEMATRNAMAGGIYSTTYWADAIGGAGRNANAESGDVYGAMIAGGHTALATDLTLGVFGGVAQTSLNIGNGAQTIDGTVGLFGIYGEYDLGAVRTDFSLVGGLSGNDSHRTLTGGNLEEILSASYGGWFIAPTVGAYVPVLTTETAEVSVGAKLGYLAGGFGGYTETGGEGGLIVGAQSYGIFTALAEVRGENTVSDTVTINGSLGVFAQNRSGSDVAVSFADSFEPLIGPGVTGGSGVGVKAGIGAEVALSDAFNITAGVTGNWRSSGTIAASANLGIGGKF